MAVNDYKTTAEARKLWAFGFRLDDITCWQRQRGRLLHPLAASIFLRLPTYL